ncbi:DUF3908 family protein [Neobacillus sp. GCM10023253]|uniref:DUF3908 family protein n=1 Tax=Neobacillus sp. GCM10023253 TaxID=3252644 RepID=UPI003613CF9E
MELNLETLARNEYQLSLPNEYRIGSIQAAVETLTKLGLGEGIEEIYQKNIFTGEMLVLLLFYKNKLIKVDFSKADLIDNINIEIFKYDNLKVFKYRTWSDNLNNCSISMEFVSGEVIDLNNCNDTNSHWAYKFGKKINNIFKILNAAQ